MNKFYLPFLIAIILFSTSCNKNKFEGTYSSNEGPYFKFTKNQQFEFGIPEDRNPLKGNFTKNGDSIHLVANSIILGNYATTIFDCVLNNDTLLIKALHINHPKFEILINKSENYARTVRDTVMKELKLDTPEAEEELFIYYKLVFDKFIKRKGG